MSGFLFLILLVVIIILFAKLSKYRMENTKLQSALRRLLEQERISAQEYFQATGKAAPGSTTYTWNGQTLVTNPTKENSQAASNPSVAAEKTAAAAISAAPNHAQAQPVPQNNLYRWHGAVAAPKPSATPNPVPVSYPTSPMQDTLTAPAPSAPKKKPSRAVSTVGILLVLGVLFILASGLIFATTTWEYLANGAKAIIISSFCILFFGVSALSEYKLRLKQTGVAFYALGCAFLPITLLAIGWLRLFGEWFSLFGGGRFFLALTASLLLGAACALGTFHYHSRIFAWLTYICASAVMLFASWALVPSRAGSSFVLSLLALAVMVSADLLGKKTQETQSLLLARYPRYASLNTFFCGIWTMLISGTGAFAFLCAVMLAIACLQKPLRKSPLGSVLFALFVFSSVLRIGGQSMDSLWLLMGLALLPVTAVSQMKVFEGTAARIFTWMVQALTLFALLFGGLFAAVSSFFSHGWEGIWTFPMLGAVILLLLNLTWQTITQRDSLLRLFHPVVLLLVFGGITQLFLNRWGFAVLCTAGYFVYRFLPVPGGKLRTDASDALMAAGCFVSGSLFLRDAWIMHLFTNPDANSAALDALLCFSMLCIIMLAAALLWDGKLSDRIFSIILPFAPITLIFPLRLLFWMRIPGEWFYYGYSLLLAAAAYLGLLCEKPFCKRLYQPFGIALNLNAVFCILISLFHEQFPLILWLAAGWWGILLVVTLRKKSEEQKTVSLICLSVWVSGGFLLLAAVLTSVNLLPAAALTLHLCAPAALFVILFFVWMFLRQNQSAHILIRPLSMLVSVAFCLLYLFCTLHYLLGFWSVPTTATVLLALTLGVFTFTSLRLSGFDWMNAFPVAIVPLLISLWIENTFSLGDFQKSLCGIGLLLIFFCLSRILYPAFFRRQPLSIDWFWALGWTILPFFAFTEPSFIWLLLACYATGFLRRISGQFADRSILTLALIFLSAAWWTRPGLYPPAWLALECQLLAPIIVLLLMRYLIWKDYPEKAHLVFLGGFLLCGLTLGFDAIYNGTIRDFVLLNLLGFTILALGYFTQKPLFGWVLGWIGPAALILTAQPKFSFWGFLLLAIYALTFLRRLKQPWGNSAAWIGALFCLSCMWWIQPYLAVPHLFATELNLLALVLLALSVRFWLWKTWKYSPILLFLVSCASIFILVAEALFYRFAEDAIMIGVITLTMLLISFWIRSKRWFLLSALTLVGVVLYLTRSFWLSLAWWIYLLAAGILLISFASANEFFRQRGSNLPRQFSRLMDDWRW